LLSHYLQKSDVDQLQLGYLTSSNEDSSEDETILLSSYPRSGNTLLRLIIEEVMSVITGSDCDMDRPLNMELFNKGMKGEGICDKRMWIVKSHFPERWSS
jgi:hypothetical protein